MAEIITLDLSSPAVQYLCKKDKRLSKVIHMVGPISYVPHATDSYSFLVHEIIEQMLSVKAGAKIYGRLKELCSERVTPDAINALSNDQIKNVGTSTAKVTYIRNLTKAVKMGEIVIEELSSMSDQQVIKRLTSIRGLGKWSAKMYLIFALDRPDVLPTEDVAFLQGYEWIYKTKDRSEAAVMKKCKKWSPYSSIAARYLYRALDLGLTKEEFHLFL